MSMFEKRVEAAYQAWISFPHKWGVNNAVDAIRAALEAADAVAPAVGAVNKIIQEHLDIYKEFHEHHGISLKEDKEAWRELLDEDPEMQLSMNWADLAGACSPQEIQEFRDWLEATDD